MTVPAPCTPDFREQPLWWDDAGLPELEPTMPPPRQVSVVVVGAGYTGLAAALELRRRNIDTVVVDRAELGRGASGRNGGMIHAGLHRDLQWLERRLGERGRALRVASVSAVDLVERLAAEVAPDAGFERCGWLHLAHLSSRLMALRGEQVARRTSGESTRMLEQAEIGEESSCRGFAGALLTDNGASIHPGRYLAGLARAALAAGARIHPGLEVLSVEERPEMGPRVHTAAGPIDARHLLVATNGYTSSAFPVLRRRVIPIGSYIIATEPLPRAVADSVSRHGRMMTDTRELLHYWRLSPDRRLIFGGRTSFAPITLQRARDRLYAAMLRIYPQLDGIRVSHAWTGTVAFTMDRLPHLGRRGGMTYAMGYCGSGVAMATWLGTRAGAWIADEPPGPFAGLPFPTLPAYTGRPWFLPAVGWYYQVRDRLP